MEQGTVVMGPCGGQAVVTCCECQFMFLGWLWHRSDGKGENESTDAIDAGAHCSFNFKSGLDERD